MHAHILKRTFLEWCFWSSWTRLVTCEWPISLW